MCGWVHARTSAAEVLIDLRDSHLRAEDAMVLAEALNDNPRLTSIDVRGNPGLTEAGVEAIIAAMRAARDGGDAELAIDLAGRGKSAAELALGLDSSTAKTFDMVVKAWTRARDAGDPLPG